MVAAGRAGGLTGLGAFRVEHTLGGLAGAAIVLVSLVTVRTLGAAGVAAAAVAGQVSIAALLDRVGVLGLDRVNLTPLRVLGMTLMILETLALTSR